jgi:hypothetical protein
VQKPGDARPRCRLCGDVIGVYEPMVVLGCGGPRETSRLIESGRDDPQEAGFHRECYVRAHGEPAGGE